MKNDDRERSGSEEGRKGSPAFSPRRKLVRSDALQTRGGKGPLDRKRSIAGEDQRAHKASVGMPPFLRASRRRGGWRQS